MTTHERRSTPMRKAAFLFALALPLPAIAQDGSPHPPQGEDEFESLEDMINPTQKSAQQEMLEIFAEVERKLSTIDAFLADASAGDTSRLDGLEESGLLDLLQEPPPDSAGGAGGAGESGGQAGGGSPETGGIGTLLSASGAGGRQVIDGIDRILELVAQSGQPKPSSGQGGQQPGQGQGQGKGDGQGQPKTDGSQNESIEREQGAKEPGEGEEERQGQGDPEGEKPGGEEENGESGDPKGNQDSDQDPKNERTDGMPDQETGEGVRAIPEFERWGELPIYQRDLFRAEGKDKLPARYRDWIDSYYRKLNRRAEGGR